METYDYSVAGARIKALRKKKHLNQIELANLIGKSLRTVQKYETGEIEVSIAVVNQLAEVLDSTPTYIMGYDTEVTPIRSLADVLNFLFSIDTKDLHHSGQVDECELRGVWYEGEHALTKESLPEVHAIESSDELVAIPYLDAGCKALTMELSVGLDDVRAEPGSFFFVTVLSGGTAPYDALEVLVEGGAVAVLIDELLHGMADMDLVREDDEPLERTEPKGLFLFERVPWEETVGISQQQTIDTQVTAYGY